MSFTEVVFRKERDNQVVALFPYEVENKPKGLISCYAHLGQHSTADYRGVVNESKPANELEYKSLYNELISIGYKLNVVKKANGKKIALAFRTARS